MNGTKEIRSYLSEIKTSLNAFIDTLVIENEEQKFENVPTSKFEHILSQNSFEFELTAQSDTV